MDETTGQTTGQTTGHSSDHLPTYTAATPPRPRTADELRAAIPGWGVDLDPAVRPAVPRELPPDPTRYGAHWEFPERQPQLFPRERSVEHAFITPVFGTAQPLRGVAGAIRSYAYGRFSEARAAHWLLLVAADRVDAWEHHVASFATTRPDNPVTQTGILAEPSHRPIASRRGVGRSDLAHAWLDPVVVAGPWVVAAVGAVAAVRAVVSVVTRRSTPPPRPGRARRAWS